MKKIDLKIDQHYRHRNRGICIFTDPCAVFELHNPDPSSVCMEIDGEMQEVSLSLIEKIHKDPTT